MASQVVTTVGAKPITTPSVDRVTIWNLAGEARTVWPVDAKELLATGRWLSEKPAKTNGAEIVEQAQEQVKRRGRDRSDDRPTEV